MHFFFPLIHNVALCCNCMMTVPFLWHRLIITADVFIQICKCSLLGMQQLLDVLCAFLGRLTAFVTLY